MIDALREKYELCELLGKLKLSRSSYYYTKNHSSSDDKYRDLRAKVKDIFKESNAAYGYRRIHAEIRKTYGKVSEKIIRCKRKDMRFNELDIEKYIGSGDHWKAFESGEQTKQMIIHLAEILDQLEPQGEDNLHTI